MTAEFVGRSVVVVGAAGGIGGAVAEAFAAEGARLALWDRAGEGLERIADRVRAAGVDATVHPTDLRFEDAVRDSAAATAAAHGPLHALVNAAGLLRQGRITEMSADDFDAIVAVNVRGVFFAIKHLAPHLADGGAIVNLSSVSAYVGSDGSWAYTMTKGAVSSLTFGIAQELARDGIRVNAVCPGWVDAGFTDRARAEAADPAALDAAARDAHVLGRMARPDEVAQAVLYLASPTRASFVTGTELFVDGGFMVKR